jgi:rod shape-determining protein MreC
MRDTKRTRTILGLLLLTSLTVVVLSLRGGGGAARDSASGIFGPVENAASAVVRPVRDFLASISSLGSKDQQIADLQQQVDGLQQQLNTTQYDHNRAQELNDLLRLAGAGQYKTLPAQTIAYGPAQGFAWTVTIDVGSKDGVKVDQSVLNGQGLVGRVVATTSSTATVALLVDATSTVGARVESSMEVGFLNGTGDPRSLELQLLDPFAPVTVGDRLVSYGVKGGAYVPGVPLGTITSVEGTPGQLTRIAKVQPFVDVTSLDLVGVVVQPPRTDPRDTVLPPKPTPSASSSASATGTTGTTGTTGATAGASPSPNPSAS